MCDHLINLQQKRPEQTRGRSQWTDPNLAPPPPSTPRAGRQCPRRIVALEAPHPREARAARSPHGDRTALGRRPIRPRSIGARAPSLLSLALRRIARSVKSGRSRHPPRRAADVPSRFARRARGAICRPRFHSSDAGGRGVGEADGLGARGGSFCRCRGGGASDRPEFRRGVGLSTISRSLLRRADADEDAHSVGVPSRSAASAPKLGLLFGVCAPENGARLERP